MDKKVSVRKFVYVSLMLILPIVITLITLPDSVNKVLKNRVIYNKKSTNDFIYNNEQKFRRNIVIVTKARSGSTFTLSLFSLNSGVFSTSEPVSMFMMTKTNFFFNTSLEKVNIIKNILSCNFKKDLNYNNKRLDKNNDIEYLYRNCLKSNTENNCKSWKLDVYEKWCKSSNYHVMKTMLPFKGINYLINRDKFKLSIIHLVRDPRGIMSSVIDLKKINPSTTASDNISNLCTEMQEDLDQSNILRKQYKYYRQVKFEELALHPEKEVKMLYYFVGLNYTSKINKLVLYKTTNLKYQDKPYVTTKFSKLVPFAWREKLTFQYVKKIQNYCKSVLERLGYRIFNSLEEYKNKNLSVIIIRR